MNERRWLVTPIGTYEAKNIEEVRVGNEYALVPNSAGETKVSCHYLLVHSFGVSGAVLNFSVSEKATADRALRRVSKWLTEGESGNLHWTKAGFRLRKVKG